MPPTFKTQTEIFNDLKTQVQVEIPEITNWGPKGVARCLVAVISAALRIIYVVLQSLYFNMFPQDADLETLKRFYDEWGLTWDDPDLETARRTVLNKFQESSVIGTKKWYEQTVKFQFDVVTDAVAYPNYRGPGTVDLFVLHNGGSVGDDDLEDIRDFFGQDANKVIGVDLTVRTAEESYA